MKMQLAKHAVMILNASPLNSRQPKTYSPLTIMIEKALEWKKSCKIHIGAYTQVHEDRNVTNTLEERTQGIICLGPTGNIQGTYNLFLLCSGKKITHG